MSLINQMLRDLEQRNRPTPASTQPLNIQLAQTPRKPAMVWLGLLAVLLVGGYAWRWQVQQPPLIDQHVPAVTHTTPPVVAHDIQPATAIEPPSAISVEPKATAPTPISRADTAQTDAPPSSAAPLADSDTRLVPALPTKRDTRKKSQLTPDPLQRAENLYREAQNESSALMRSETLQEALTLNPRHLPARNLLLQSLLKSNSLQLEAFLQESLQLFPNHLPFITSLAHRQIQRKDFVAASATLERVDSQHIDDADYLSLLAASYQQQQRFPSALALYQRLTERQPEKAEYWLGLGVCADHLQQRQTAITAYRQALAKNTLNDRVVDYIKQRLMGLNPPSAQDAQIE